VLSQHIDPPRQVNITSDSAPGWVPSVELEQAARDTALAYLADEDRGRAAEAYALRDRGLQAMEPREAFTDSLVKFNALAGPVTLRRIVQITWTKDPAQAPAPGVYAAIDLVSRFTNVDRHCGYLVLYQPPEGGPFRVSREEINYLGNDEVKNAASPEARAKLEAAWAQVSAKCPNYPGEVASDAGPLPEAEHSTIGYPTVAAALAALHANPAVKFSIQRGWTIATDEADATIWSFPPEGDPAYPSAVRRQLAPSPGGGTSIETNVQCEASKEACDNLVRSFEQLNAQMRAYIQQRAR
jgi:hypothetical protein